LHSSLIIGIMCRALCVYVLQGPLLLCRKMRLWFLCYGLCFFTHNLAMILQRDTHYSLQSKGYHPCGWYLNIWKSWTTIWL
jgi:hypothetical protein